MASSPAVANRRAWHALHPGAALALGLTLIWLTTLIAAPPARADGPTTFSAPGTITVPAAGSANQTGPASPYPSTVAVSGMAGNVSAISVTLDGLTHAIAGDFEVLLVAPNGDNLILISDLFPDSGVPANNVDLTFSDTATAQLPDAGPLTSGTFRPRNNNDGQPDAFPAPAPAPSGATSMTTFLGDDPNGTWQLFVVDDAPGDTGSIANGWSLTITTAVAVQPGQLSFEAAQYRGREGAGGVDLTVTRIAGSDGEVSALVTTQSGTAVAGTDFTAVSTRVVLGDGVTRATVRVPFIDDDAAGSVDLSLQAALSAPAGGATIGAQSTTTVFIEDDDSLSNLSGIAVPSVGTADPYPSNLHVQGQPSRLTNVRVTLTGITHTTPTDLDVLLVGPEGQTLLLLSDAGGSAAATGVDLVFDDDAPGGVPTTSLPPGTYRPTNADDGGGADSFPAPAPGPPWGAALSVFDGTDPNGTWRLFVRDDASGDSGSIDGWSLELTGASADAGGPYAIAEGDSLTLSGSVDAGVPGPEFAWDLDDDGGFDDATGASPTVGPATLAGLGLGDGPLADAPVALRVTDDDQNTYTDTSTVTVTNVAPTAVFGSDVTVAEGGPAPTVRFTSASDPSAADEAAGLRFSYDTDGDGTFDLGDGSYAGSVTDTEATVAASVLADNPGATIRGRVIDKDGGRTDYTLTVTVTNTAPTATLTNTGPVANGSTATVTLTDLDDPSGPDLAAGLDFTFDLDDDGTPEVTGTWTTGDPDPTATVPRTVLTGVGTYPVTATLTDKDGGTTTLTTQIRVVASQPTATLTNSGPVNEGGTATVTFTDPTDPSGATAFTYSYDFDGDGAFDGPDDIANSPDATAPVPTTLTDDGPATVTVRGRIANPDGGFTDHDTQIEITNLAPSVDVALPDRARVGVEVIVDLVIDDPSPIDVAAGFDVTVDFGDGTTARPGDFAAVAAAAAILQSPAQVAHTYETPGSYRVVVTVADKDGGEARVSATIVIEPTSGPRPPSGPSAPPPGGNGSDLADTGGAPVWPLPGGLALVLLAAALIGYGRRPARHR